MQWLHVYVIDCKFSVKFDIFSFGVLLLEIVAGIKNGGSIIQTTTIIFWDMQVERMKIHLCHTYTSKTHALSCFSDKVYGFQLL